MLDGAPLPGLRKDAVGELVLRPEAIEELKDRTRFVQDYTALIVERSAVVYVGVSPHLVDSEAPGLIRNPQALDIRSEYWLVEVRLQDDLYIRIRGDQEARLEKCRCLIPALNKEATSINHAFTLVSEAYETQRLSHTGNVFDRAYALFTPRVWRPLDDFRIKAIADSLEKKNTSASAAG